MLSFKQYLIEITQWVGSSSWALSRRHGLEVVSQASQDHPEIFPHLHFPGWAYHSSGFNDPKGKEVAQVWGRIDPTNKELHMTSPLIFGGDGGLYGEGVPHATLKQDIVTRLDALEGLRKQFPDYRIDTGMVDYDKPLDPSGTKFAKIYHGFDQHYKWLSQKLESLG
jgi:hypothetical protein